MIYRSLKRSSYAPCDHTVLPKPPIRVIPARAVQDVEHYFPNELVNVANHFTDLGRMELLVKVCAR